MRIAKRMRPEIGDFKCERAQLKITRILKIIDLLASFSHPKTSTEIWQLIREDSAVCQRSVIRDLELLTVMNLVHVERLPAKSGIGTLVYKLDLRRTERLQEVAISVVDQR